MIPPWYPIILAGAVAASWGVWTVVADESSRKWQPMTQDEVELLKLHLKMESDYVDALAAARFADQQAWEINFQIAKHEVHKRELAEKARRERWFWDGTITIGEDVA